jgi:thiamine pyrophosphate-dependent acetolactate synthase large subunit-like protein
LVGFGLALAQPKRRVLVVTGDGEQLMGLGGFATIAAARPRNLVIAVIDNQHYGETGMQASHTGRGIDLAAIAGASGFASAETLRSLEEIAAVVPSLNQEAAGPRLFVIKVSADSPPSSMPSRDAVFIKNRFRAHLGFAAQ